MLPVWTSRAEWRYRKYDTQAPRTYVRKIPRITSTRFTRTSFLYFLTRARARARGSRRFSVQVLVSLQSGSSGVLWPPSFNLHISWFSGFPSRTDDDEIVLVYTRWLTENGPFVPPHQRAPNPSWYISSNSVLIVSSDEKRDSDRHSDFSRAFMTKYFRNVSYPLFYFIAYRCTISLLFIIAECLL